MIDLVRRDDVGARGRRNAGAGAAERVNAREQVFREPDGLGVMLVHGGPLWKLKRGRSPGLHCTPPRNRPPAHHASVDSRRVKPHAGRLATTESAAVRYS